MYVEILRQKLQLVPITLPAPCCLGLNLLSLSFRLWHIPSVCSGFPFNKLVCVSHSVVSYSSQSRALCPARLLCPWDSPGKNTGVGCHALLQRIFPTQAWILVKKKQKTKNKLCCVYVPFEP